MRTGDPAAPEAVFLGIRAIRHVNIAVYGLLEANPSRQEWGVLQAIDSEERIPPADLIAASGLHARAAQDWPCFDSRMIRVEPEMLPGDGRIRSLMFVFSLCNLVYGATEHLIGKAMGGRRISLERILSDLSNNQAISAHVVPNEGIVEVSRLSD